MSRNYKCSANHFFSVVSSINFVVYFVLVRHEVELKMQFEISLLSVVGGGKLRTYLSLVLL